MKFELNEYHKNISKDELLEDLCIVAKKLNKSYLSRSEYEKNGKYSATPSINNFGSWLVACKEAGLRTTRNKEDFVHISDEDLLEDMVQVSKLLKKKSISTKDYSDYGKYKVQTILSRFLKWSEALKKANLEQTNFKIIGDKDLFVDIERMWIQKGKQPTSTDVKNGLSEYSLNTYSRRFGGWRNALEAFLEYTNLDSSEETDEEIKENKINAQDNISKTVNLEKSPQKKKHRTSRDINERIRFKVLKRDNFKCCACGASPAKDPAVELHVDHIIPWSKGGETVIDNLQTLCSKCNLGKSDIL
jgi:hypothetical protein